MENSDLAPSAIGAVQTKLQPHYQLRWFFGDCPSAESVVSYFGQLLFTKCQIISVYQEVVVTGSEKLKPPNRHGQKHKMKSKPS
ncbi:hypothetical protein T4D_12391 [Trichinella pseudospiralis]|uniref:Uncharacterized protein n=1 Tax=Trichinella pseudospiralis TaxID=6337 RepID=A0A0V1G1H3_TRIPS|nr:hypothetical protein T4D_12391 [Trichinella pseudospiralis]